MEFATFADRAEAIEVETADLEIVDLVATLFVDAASDLPLVVRFVQGRVFPAWSPRTLDVGPSACHAAIARAAGPNVDAGDVEDRLAEIGEIGAVAASYDFGGQRGLGTYTGSAAASPEEAPSHDDNVSPGRLTVCTVHDELSAIAAADGAGSQGSKGDRLFGLFNRCSSVEARYLARIVLEEMRIGVGEGTVRDAIAGAFDVPIGTVERALQVSNDYGHVAETARESGEPGLDSMRMAVGRPVKPMLAQAGTVRGALDDWDEAAVEWKYDGARIQLHYDGSAVGGTDPGGTRVYSRNMEDVTTALPEVVEFADERLDAPAILDGEVVAVDDEGETLPFQQVLRRFRRKHDVAGTREDVEIRPVFFDCLHADGEDLLDEVLVDRHARLRRLIAGATSAPTDGESASGEGIEGLSVLWRSDDPAEIESIDATALSAGHEGIVLKDPRSTYTPGRRGKRWRKRKPDVETIDCVVTAAEWGEGRRASVLGTFELSVRDGDDLATIGKVATGLTDEELAALTELLESHVERRSGQRVELSPRVVVEVGTEEVQPSPTYGSGYALRFPRFLGVRHDLDTDDADDVRRIERLHDGE